MPKGLKHTEETKSKISEAAIRTMRQSNAGFKQRVSCDLCGSIMSPANLGKHFVRCQETRGVILNGKELTVKEIAALRKTMKLTGWSVSDFILHNEMQGGACAICLQIPQKGRLYADHCHRTSKPRGLLCSDCNMALGMFKDNPELLLRAAEYLKTHKD